MPLGQFLDPKLPSSVVATTATSHSSTSSLTADTKDGVLLKWHIDFGSTLDNCVIINASFVFHPKDLADYTTTNCNTINDNKSIPNSLYTNGSLKLRVVWTIRPLIATRVHPPCQSSHQTEAHQVLTFFQ